MFLQDCQSLLCGVFSLFHFYPCMENILYVLTFCDPLGINILTPPEALHAILLGHGTHLLNAFARLEKEQKEKKKKDDGEEEEEQDSEEEDEEKPSEKQRKNFIFRRIWKTGCH